MSDSATFDLETAKQLAIKTIPFIERTGAELLELEPGRLKAKMPFEPNINHIGTMYAGALYTLAEFPGGVVFFSIFDVSKYYPIIRAQEIKFLKPATTDVTIEVEITQDESTGSSQRSTRTARPTGAGTSSSRTPTARSSPSPPTTTKAAPTPADHNP